MQTPSCSKCGAKHYNFDPCPSTPGTLTSLSLPKGAKLWRKPATGGLFAPIPTSARVWSNVASFSDWQSPKDDGPKAA